MLDAELESDELFLELSSAIGALIERFVQMPYFYHSEQDMHAFLYHKLISSKLGEFLVETYFGDRTVLVHKEYPTIHAYPGPRGVRTRGHFDLVILDPAHVSESHWRTHITEPAYSRHRPKAALELGLNAIGTSRFDLAHFKKDFERLTDPANMVERGYLLFFVRREDYPVSSGMLTMIDKVPGMLEKEYEEKHDRASNLVVVYVECRLPGSSRLRIIPENRSHWID